MGRTATFRCVVGALGVAGVLAGCGGGGGRGEAAFCSALGKDLAVVSDVQDAAGVKAAVSHYQALDKIAPEAIRDEWHQLSLLVEQAATVDPSNADASSALVSQAFSASEAAQKVTTYAQTTCHVDLAAGAANASTTTAPQTTAPAPTTG